LALVNPEAPRIDHGDRARRWIAADVDGNRYHRGRVANQRQIGAVSGPATLSAPDGTVRPLTLTFILCWGRGGYLDDATVIADRDRARGARIQFGKPLADFQAGQVRRRGRVRRGARTWMKARQYTVSRPKSTRPSSFGGRTGAWLKAADTDAWCYEPLTSCSARSLL